MNPETLKLSLEQEFTLRSITDSMKEADHEQIVDLLLSTSELLMVKDNLIKDLVRQLAV